MGFNTYPPNPFPPNSESVGGGSPYVLPIATSETLGGVKVGNGLTINGETGVLSANRQIFDYSVNEQNTGQKWVDGKDIYFKTFTNVGVTPNASNWSDVVEIPGIASIVKVELLSDTGIYISGNGIELNINNSMLRAVYNQSLNMRTIGTMTIWYTKSTT